MKKELLEQTQALQTKFAGIRDTLQLDTKQTELTQLQRQMGEPDFWNDQSQAQTVSQKAAHLEQYIKRWQTMQTSLEDLPELIDIANDAELAELQSEVEKLSAAFQQGETELLLSGEYDQRNALLSLHVGNGGQDAEDFTQMLLRMYLRFCEQRGWKTKVLDESPSDAGLKSVTLEITAPLAYGYLKSEHGVHRLIRLSPFNAKNLRQTSFARVEIMPVLENDTELEIDDNDLRIDVFRSSGAGGQSVNTTDSAVRVTYLPLNLVVTCQNERSQLQNKETALKILQGRLAQLKLEQHAEKLSEIRGEMMENAFGSQIRTYTLQPYKLVKDHRTDHEHSNPDKVFDGDLEGFIEAFLRHR